MRITARMNTIFYVIFWFFVVLFVRLFQVQVVEAGRFKEMAQMEHTEKVLISAVRGSIYDRNGELLAVNTSGYSVACEPQKILDRQKTAESLGSILKMQTKEVLSILESSQPFVWISRKIEPGEVALINELKLPGIEVVKEPTGKRLYPRGDLACHVLGYTGVDDQGLDGIELYYDKELRGNPGYFLASIDGLGRVMPDGVSKMIQAVPGGDLTLTLDESVQYLAQSELSKCVKAHKARSGTIIVMNPENGEILAFASYPDFNGNRYEDYPASALRDHAISDDYEPGSTFKAVLAAAALDSGKITTDEKFLASPSISVGGWQIRNADDDLTPVAPLQNIQTIIQDSLNVGAASIALKIGTSPFAEMIRRFGFFRTTGIDLPGEASALIPSPKEWQPVQLATISFGQGIAVTPLQMATAYAEIANGGHPIRPHLLKKAVFPDGNVREEPESSEAVSIMKPETCREVQDLLARVVKSGTGTSAALPAYTSAGKTGTAQVSENGVYLPGKYVASFIGFAPAEKPAFLIMVKIDEPAFPYWGGTVSAPVFKTIASEMLWHLQIPPSKGMTRVGSFEVWANSLSKRL